MLMSKSRLEKFLYALYSLNSSDLPTPLSRIEELYKCLVTGEEVPTFEPLSRVEKYLMAILGGYDVELLPNPLSRVEVLLYKLATGDDNLDDVKSFLSEHEELLAEIIRNRGAVGNIEYVLYTLSTKFNTLYKTAEEPVKSAILKGNTIKNEVKTVALWYSFGLNYSTFPIKANTRYLITWNFNVSPSRVGFLYYDSDGKATFNGTVYNASFPSTGRVILASGAVDNNDTFRFRFDVSAPSEQPSGEAMVIEYQDGMENWDIPYFEGIRSVKMPVLTTSNEDSTKTNILTVNEEVELRAVGDVKDELDCMTGELTQRIGEVVLDGSEDEEWSVDSPKGTTNRYLLLVDNLKDVYKYSDSINCDKWRVFIPVQGETENQEGIYINGWVDKIHIGVDVSRLSENSLSGFKQWLSDNPLTVQFLLDKEVIKTVDLSVVNQDRNNTELSTFNGNTHVTLSSEGVIPEAELEVATKTWKF